MPREQPDPEDVLEQIRTNWAFEHLIVAVLTGAGVGGTLTFLWTLAAAFSGASIGAVLASALTTGLLTAFLVFLIGFLSGVLVIAPLFRAMERMKRRSVWPYVAAFLVIAAAALALASGFRGPVGPNVAAPVIISSIVIAVLFARRMRPLWRAAERAELEEGEQAPKRLQ